MRDQKKAHELIRQNEKSVKKSQKHGANLQKNSVLYFQVGLIVVLLAIYGLFEMKFETTIPNGGCPIQEPDEFAEVSIDKIKIYEETAKEPIEQPVKKVILTTTPTIVGNDFKIKNPIEVNTGEQNSTSERPIDPSSVKVLDEPVEEDFLYNFVEQVPIYPGCENAKNNMERRKCMSDKINKLVQKKFDGNIASEYGLSGIQRISVEFKIDKTGHVTNIKTRATHPKLEEEAERVVKKIPDMIPGKQQDKTVGVIYSLPIIFKVQD